MMSRDELAGHVKKHVNKVQQHSRFHVATGINWLVTITLYFTCSYIENNVKPHQQDITQYIGDPDYRFPHVEHQHVPADLLYDLTFYMPLAVVLIVGAARASPKEMHYGVLSYFAGYNFTWLATEFIKLQVGRLRPDFFDRCQLDPDLGTCTGDLALIQDGRKSFPSGHSSGAFYTGVFLFLFLAGKNGALQFGKVDPTYAGAKLLNLLVAFAPLFMAVYIAVSRWQDHIHHPTDIMAGSLLGALMGLLIYCVFWPAPFRRSNETTMSHPRAVNVKTSTSSSEDTESRYGATEGERAPLLSSS